ncbi:MAG: hypothetical protein WBD36_13185 [Bacteroidota bacterium]
MNKKVWLGFAAVFVTLEILDYVVNGFILKSMYASITIWRSDMNAKMWIFSLVTLIGSYFLSFIFSKGYEGKGMPEGIRYGLYTGIWLNVGKAYGTYAMIAIPYTLALEWFLYGVVEYMIAGMVLAMVFSSGKSEPGKI